MKDPQYLTKCIGEELRFVFAHAMDVNLEGGFANCTGSMSSDNQLNYDRTEIKVVFGNRMKNGFYISSDILRGDSGVTELKLDLKPLGNFDDRFSKSKLMSCEVLKSIRLLNKGIISALCMTFESGNSFLFSAHELDQSETGIEVSFVSKADETALEGYETKEIYDTHEV